jgi:large subunit ribosomal protein L24
MKLRIKTGDTVKVLTGKDSGKTGKVIQTFPKLNRVVVEGLNISKRHLRTRQRGEKGQTVEFSMPIPASNVQIVGEDGKTRRHKQRNRSGRAEGSKAAAKKEAAPETDGKKK